MLAAPIHAGSIEQRTSTMLSSSVRFIEAPSYGDTFTAGGTVVELAAAAAPELLDAPISFPMALALLDAHNRANLCVNNPQDVHVDLKA